MDELNFRLWPYTRRSSILSAILLLIGLSLVIAILRAKMDWPRAESEGWILLAVAVVSLIPIVLTMFDVIIERGGVIEYGGAKIDFSHMRQLGSPSIIVPANIGVRGQSVTDSSTTEILDALKRATNCDVVVVDLEEGQAWWETRLLVLLAGAERLQRPEKIVFVATDSKKQECFQGWAHPKELLRPLLRAHPQYERSFLAARAAARQWELVEPAVTGAPPGPHPGIHGNLATRHPWMAFDPNTGLPNDLLAEQLLQSDLGTNVEMIEAPTGITLVRLRELFGPVLSQEQIDLRWPAEQQTREFLKGDAAYMAITENGRYSTIVSRFAVLNQILTPLVLKRTS